jgi:LPS-assembly lipoprotein
MSWAERRGAGISAIFAGVLLLACCALVGCGFHPVYATSGSGEFDQRLASVTITPIAERMGQILANTLRDNFNPTGAKVEQRYALSVVLQSSSSDYAIRKDGTASRELLNVTGSFSMIELGKSGPVLYGTVRTNSSYDVGENPYSAIVANSDAQTRAAQEIAADIRTRVALYFRRQKAGP